MFYAHFVLSKKGPLARIWLAAHWDKKLTKAHVFETNIEGSVEAIIQPKVKLALRTSGHLLLGVVRIYSRKAKYLLADCNEAFVKIKMAFRPGVVDLPEENREAAVAAITLPETFHDFDTTMADLTDIDVQPQFTVHQGRPEEITMREDLGNITLVGDDGFGDLGFGAGDNMLGDVHMDDTLFVKNPEQSLNEEGKEKAMDIDLQPPPSDFVNDLATYEDPAGVEDDDDDDNDGGGDFGGGLDTGLFDNLGGGLFEEPPPPPPPAEITLPTPEETTPKDSSQESSKETDKTAGPEDTRIQEQTTIREQTTLIPNEAEAFALEPIDVTSLGTERRTKRKRKLIIDEQKGIPSESMKVQLSDTSDIITTLDLAPPTKKLMHWKETGGVEKLFALPGRSLVSKRITQLFNDSLITKPLVDADFEQQCGLDLEQGREPEDEVSSVNMTTDEPSIEQNRQQQQSTLEPPSLTLDESNTSQLPAPEPSIVPEAPSLHDDTLVNQRTLDFDDDDDEVGGPPSLASHREFSEDEDNAAFDDDLTAPPDDSAQMEPGESVDAFEERRWKGRTQQMMHILQRRFNSNSQVSFHDMVSRNNRKQVASKFYTLLVLKKLAAIDVEQNGPFGDIMISTGPKASSIL